ncbi:hypothetical protein BGZ72_010164 [Mortierella alpina]|nr:hypothetical protein BGZ72_010164 [Mortierella alpina]
MTMPQHLVGGISQNVTVIDEDHPLSLLDPALEALLIKQAPLILSHYCGHKGLPSDADFIQFRPIQFTTQVVAGMNYYVKLSVVHENQDSTRNTEEYIHVRFFHQPWTETTQLTGMQVNKQLDDGFAYDF